MKKFGIFLVISFFLGGFGLMALAQAQTGVPPVPISEQDYFVQVLGFIKDFGGLSTVMKIAGAITLILSSMKVSFLNELIWSKLGALQVWAAPILGLIAGFLSQGSQLTVPAALAYLASGAGAIILHELLDSVKSVPGLGAKWVSFIEFIKSIFGGPKTIAKAKYL